jgi:hypothetical protein
MGPSKQFIPRLPDYNEDRRNQGFYNFSNNEEEGQGNTLEGGDQELHNDSDADADNANNIAIPVDDPGLQTFAGGTHPFFVA